ncbi:MAG: hypothetical protein SP1CHLAM54_01340 [Chlamydiia bacterium]|nr:hypothetical protein [Chlamydiia bacterium]MCH9615055.1 hypothetical protein [Chlamydiia bacterium]MCH9629894.1 hypothetical protein [Chlamydiia bacterium]
MNRKALFIPLLSLLVVGCNNKNNDETAQVVAKRYIHKYGYDVSPSEWNDATYPGQVVTTLRNGVTKTATYESGVLNGPTTFTFPHSQTRSSLEMYDQGNLVKKVSYTIRGIPAEEQLFISPTHVKSTQWFTNGSPMSVEEHEDGLLMTGEYRNLNNETVSEIKGGKGMRLLKCGETDRILVKEIIDEGRCSHRESYHENAVPYMSYDLFNGVLHGTKKIFATSGEPVSIESYNMDVLDGLATYFQNGSRYLELSFKNGLKDGIERHYVDGETIVEETHWLSGAKHGPSTIYYDGMSKTEWFYNNELVSKTKYDDLVSREHTIAIMNERSKTKIAY